MFNILKRLKVLNRTELLGSNSRLFIDKNVDIHLSKNSKIIINNGVLKIGGNPPNSLGMPSLNKTMLVLEEDSQLVINGDVFISSGTYLSLSKKSKAVFKGKNYIGRDNKIFVHDFMSIGRNTSTSWNVTIMEDDGHDIFHHTGKPIKKRYKQMILGDNVGIQMNVTIPRGIVVGNNSLIAANSVVRNDVKSDHLVYTENILKEKYGFSAGLQFSEKTFTPSV